MTSVRMPRKAAVITALERRGCPCLVRLRFISSILGRDRWKLQTLRQVAEHFSHRLRVTALKRGSTQRRGCGCIEVVEL